MSMTVKELIAALERRVNDDPELANVKVAIEARSDLYVYATTVVHEYSLRDNIKHDSLIVILTIESE